MSFHISVNVLNNSLVIFLCVNESADKKIFSPYMCVECLEGIAE